MRLQPLVTPEYNISLIMQEYIINTLEYNISLVTPEYSTRLQPLPSPGFHTVRLTNAIVSVQFTQRRQY